MLYAYVLSTKCTFQAIESTERREVHQEAGSGEREEGVFFSFFLCLRFGFQDGHRSLPVWNAAERTCMNFGQNAYDLTTA